MRNDARPVGHDNTHQSPVVSHQPDIVGRQPQVERRSPSSTVENRLPDLSDLDGDDPVMPENDSTLKIQI